MFNSLRLENYRGFSRYAIDGLRHVNLLVGKNSCGKTSVLEGVSFLASGGDLNALIRTAARRGEVMPVPDERSKGRTEAKPVLRHLFHGHDFDIGSEFSLSGQPHASLSVSVVPRREEDEAPWLFREADPRIYAMSLRIRGAQRQSMQGVFPVDDNGSVLAEALVRSERRSLAAEEEASYPQFITPDSLHPHSMVDMWDRVQLEGAEEDVVRAMRVLEPDLKSIVFLSGKATYRYGGSAGVYLALRSSKQRLPLGTFGDGMRRLLALAISLIRSRNSVLLADEIGTGLHYSVMADMWRLVVEASVRFNTQIFATTHSMDCVHGLAELCRSHPALAAHVSLQKIDPRILHSVALDAHDLMLASRHGMEVR